MRPAPLCTTGRAGSRGGAFSPDSNWRCSSWHGSAASQPSLDWSAAGSRFNRELIMSETVEFGVHSEVGQLRTLMVCAPGRAHERLTPSSCDALLFDDVMWVDNAKRDHFDFMTKMRDRGVEVLEMHNLLAETVAIPEAKKWILDNQVVANQEIGRASCRERVCKYV